MSHKNKKLLDSWILIPGLYFGIMTLPWNILKWESLLTKEDSMGWDPFLCSSDVFPNALLEGQPWQSVSFRGVFCQISWRSRETDIENPLLFGGWKVYFHIPKISDSSIQAFCFFFGVPRVGRSNSASMRHERHAPPWDMNQHCCLATPAFHWPLFLGAFALPGCRGSLSEQLMKQFNLREGQDDRDIETNDADEIWCFLLLNFWLRLMLIYRFVS